MPDVRPTVSGDDLDNLLVCAARHAVTAPEGDPVRARTSGLVARQAPWLSERAATVIQRDLTGWPWDVPARDDEWVPVLDAVRNRTAPQTPRPQLAPPELDDLLLSCTYYAVGRATYVSSWMAGLLVGHGPWMDPQVRATVVDHIRDAIAAGRSGWDCDTQAWQRALTALTAEEVAR